MRIVMLALCTVVLSASCSWLKGQGKQAAADVVDCTTAKAKAAVVAYSPLVETVVLDSIDAAGRADWQRIKSTAKGVSSSVVDRATRELFGCAMQAAVNRLLDPQLLEGRPQSEPIAVDRAQLAAGWDEARAQLFGGARFAGAQ